MSRSTYWQVAVGYGAGPYRFDDEADARRFYDLHKDTPSYINPAVKHPVSLSKIVTTVTLMEKNR